MALVGIFVVGRLLCCTLRSCFLCWRLLRRRQRAVAALLLAHWKLRWFVVEHWSAILKHFSALSRNILHVIVKETGRWRLVAIFVVVQKLLLAHCAATHCSAAVHALQSTFVNRAKAVRRRFARHLGRQTHCFGLDNVVRRRRCRARSRLERHAHAQCRLRLCLLASLCRLLVALLLLHALDVVDHANLRCSAECVFLAPRAPRRRVRWCGSRTVFCGATRRLKRNGHLPQFRRHGALARHACAGRGERAIKVVASVAATWRTQATGATDAASATALSSALILTRNKIANLVQRHLAPLSARLRRTALAHHARIRLLHLSLAWHAVAANKRLRCVLRTVLAPLAVLRNKLLGASSATLADKSLRLLRTVFWLRKHRALCARALSTHRLCAHQRRLHFVFASI